MNRTLLVAGMVPLLGLTISTQVVAFDRITHDGWRFEISMPWGYKEHNHDIVTKTNGHPVRYGKRSEKFDVRPGDCGITKNGGWNDCENDRERTEMSSHGTLKYHSGDEYWYRWSLFLPKDHTNLYPVKVTFAEFKHIGCPDPMFQLLEARMKSDKGELMAYFSSADKLSGELWSMNELTRDYKGKWNDFVVHAKWSHSENGWFKVWVNGELKLDYAGKTLYCFRGIYFKYGVYRAFVSRNWDATKIGTIAYHDGIRISKTGEGMFDPLPE